jgi:hypothetical protein
MLPGTIQGYGQAFVFSESKSWTGSIWLLLGLSPTL